MTTKMIGRLRFAANLTAFSHSPCLVSPSAAKASITLSFLLRFSAWALASAVVPTLTRLPAARDAHSVG